MFIFALTRRHWHRASPREGKGLRHRKIQLKTRRHKPQGTNTQHQETQSSRNNGQEHTQTHHHQPSQHPPPSARKTLQQSAGKGFWGRRSASHTHWHCCVRRGLGLDRFWHSVDGRPFEIHFCLTLGRDAGVTLSGKRSGLRFNYFTIKNRNRRKVHITIHRHRRETIIHDRK